jgi:hypothetical protein
MQCFIINASDVELVIKRAIYRLVGTAQLRLKLYLTDSKLG